MAFNIKKSFKNLTKKVKDEEKKVAKRLHLKPWQVVGGSLLFVIVVFLTVMSIGIYKFSWGDNFTLGVTKVVPFPASKVGNSFVTYHNYLDNLNIMKKYQTEFKKVDFKSEDGKKLLTSIKKDTIDRLNEDVLAREEAKKLGVKLTSKEINDSYNDLIKSNGGDKSFAEVLKKYYGLTINEFKKDIYVDRLLRQKVSEKFASDESVNADSKKKAEEVLAKVKAGEDFANLAKQYSQDSTASNGGDLGLFSKGKMVPEFEKAAFALKEGETSELVKTVYGYHIIKVTEVKGEQIRASHILIKTKDFAAWLEETKKAAKITKFVQ